MLLWLLWYFIPAGYLFKGLTTLLIIMLAGGLLWKSFRQREGQTDGAVSMAELPLLDTQGPLVLVCGDGLDDIFQGQSLRKTAQGWWLRTGEVERLTEVVRTIQAQFPCQVGQLSVMYVCQPDQYQEEAVLRSKLKSLRQQIKQLNTLTGLTLPVVINCEFSGPETPWIIIRGDNPMVCPVNDPPQALIDWQQVDNHIALLPVLSQAFLFIRNICLDELVKTDRLIAPVHAFAVALRLGAVNPEPQSLWTSWLYHKTCLQFPLIARPSAAIHCFPDAVLPLLVPFASPIQSGRRTRYLILLVWLCSLTALGFSALNNRDLIRQVSTDLQRWAAIPMSHSVPKAESLAALKQDALLLERWQRQGEPMRYSLGFYPGQRLWLALQQAIDTYLPPAAPKVEVERPKPAEKMVSLDSLSLFDPGKAVLKEGSTKILVNALVDIKAKPDWLIVVRGYTDNTGSVQLNQRLSLQRAEAVRDWIRDTGDIPDSCFAVQGFGDSRPVASNDTPEGRARNRRVEIRLVPQADACQTPDTTSASLQDDDVNFNQMEK